MDRQTVNMAHAQLGFLDVFVQPTWEALALMLPQLEINIANTKKNKEKWKELIPLYDKKMKHEVDHNSIVEESGHDAGRNVKTGIDGAGEDGVEGVLSNDDS